jgi:hypothetical protein
MAEDPIVVIDAQLRREMLRRASRGGTALRRSAMLGALMLLGCDPEAAARKAATPAHDAFARAYLERLAARDFDHAEQSIASAVRRIPGIRDSLVATARHIPTAPLDTVRLIGQRAPTPRVARTLLSYEVHGTTGWAGVRIQVAEENGSRVVEGVQAESLPHSVSETYAFSVGWSLGGALFLTVALGIVGFVLWTVAAVLRSGMPRRWLWAAIALVGVGAVTFDWTTGAMTLELLRVQLLSAGLMKSGVAAPWLVILSVPVGAVIASERLANWSRRLGSEAATGL